MGDEGRFGNEVVLDESEWRRDKERELGVKVLEAEKEVVRDGDRENLDNRRVELGVLEQSLSLAVFEEVDTEQAWRLVGEMVGRINLGDLSKVRETLEQDPMEGAKEAEVYFSELLGIRQTPELVLMEGMTGGRVGECEMKNGGRPDLITVDLARHEGGVDELLETIAHENWHSLQNDIIRMVQESGYFTEELLKIIDEQSYLEDVERMSSEERAEAEKEQKEVGWTPVVSRKYGVRRR